MNQLIEIKAGQTLLLYKDKTIILRRDYATTASITTSWNSFIGTSSEVDAKIAELSLGNIKKPFTVKQPEVVVKMHRVGLLRRLINYIKQLI